MKNCADLKKNQKHKLFFHMVGTKLCRFKKPPKKQTFLSHGVVKIPWIYKVVSKHKPSDAFVGQVKYNT